MCAHVISRVCSTETLPMDSTPQKKLFSLEKTAVKRQANDAAAPSNKVPKVSQMKMMEQPVAKTPRVATTAPVNLCVYKVAEASGAEYCS